LVLIFIIEPAAKRPKKTEDKPGIKTTQQKNSPLNAATTTSTLTAIAHAYPTTEYSISFNLTIDANTERKPPRLSLPPVTPPLVTSPGRDFAFSDREVSLDILADYIESKYYHIQSGLHDKMYHKIPFLADGPGSGKSRFLQELSTSLSLNVSKKTHPLYANDSIPHQLSSYISSTQNYFQHYKNTLSSAIFLNISFGNGSPYVKREQTLDIEESICLRLIYPEYETEYQSFTSFCDAYINSHLHLESLSLSKYLESLKGHCRMLILGIDEVNFLYEESREQFKALFKIIGSIGSHHSDPIFVPVLAGTVIGPIQDVVSHSMYPPLHIPLPLLSINSTINILSQKDTSMANLIQKHKPLRQLIADIGGHCRALELFYSAISANNYTTDFDHIMNIVINTLTQYYPKIGLPLYGKAISCSFLSKAVNPLEHVSEHQGSLTFQELEEYGLIKLEQLRSSNTFKVKVPFIFVICFIKRTPNDEISKFWNDVLLVEKIYWEQWEEFNNSYLAFRLVLFSKLGMTRVKLSEFLNGAKMNIPNDIEIKIPPVRDLAIKKLSHRYPSTERPNFATGHAVLNARGSAFDSFMYLETVDGTLLITAQMKLAYPDSLNPQEITKDRIDLEYNKVNNTVAEFLPNTDFLLLVLGLCDGKYDERLLPSKCAIVLRTEHAEFYGDEISGRLAIRYYTLN
jgi:hypothetical protein